MNGYQNQFSQPTFAPNVQSKGKEVATEQWDDDAFERIFDQVSNALVAEEEMMDVEQDAYTKETAAPYERGASTGNVSETEAYEVRQNQGELHHMEQVSPPFETLQPLPFERLESDPVAEEMLREDTDSAVYASDSEMEQQKQQQDDDALAMTAQELLEKVEHNQTDKFRNSQFLNLMRKLRDREMRVEGNDMVETANVRAAPIGKFQPSPPASIPDSAYVSGAATPSLYFDEPSIHPHRRSPRPEFDSHVEYGWDEEHEFDHWESPYR